MDGAAGRLLVVFTLFMMHERGAASSCYVGSNDFGQQETPTTCAAGMDACVTFKITAGATTGTGYACTSQQNCQNTAVNKAYLEGQMQLLGLTATAGNMVCCTGNNCNRQTSAASSCYFGSNEFGLPETPKTCQAGMDACVTFKITEGTKTGTGYACTSQQNCQNAAVNKDYLEYQMKLLGLTATAGNMVCCTGNNCNRAGAAAAAHRIVVSMSSSPHLFFPVSVLLSRFFA
uniref:Uncharacterized protein LOC116957306 n=1 Tax=Petromyzon marinus TaxID=7757 RepID=A0AAJ7UF21_PETMA|nr:uncharacterized protein LOC116957306 [Petromyzon marinus]